MRVACRPRWQAVAELTAAELELRSLRVGPARRRSRAPKRRSRARTTRPITHACRRSWPKWRRCGLRSIVPQPGASSTAASRRCACDEVAALLDSGALVVDACRRGLRAGAAWRPLARRPVLFALARALAEAWPGEVDRQVLIARAFGTRRPNESHRARLRVEIGRLRALIASLARIDATARGFVIRPRGAGAVVLAPPIDGDQGSLRGAALRRRSLVDFGPGAGAWSQSAHRPARARRARGGRTGALDWAGAGAVAGCRRRWRDSRQSCYSQRRCRLNRVALAAPSRGARNRS